MVNQNIAFPPLTFKPEEWGMRVPWAQYDPYREEWHAIGVCDLPSIEQIQADLDADDIMSAVRDIARGG